MSDLFIQMAEELFYKNQLGFFDFDKPTPEYEVEEFVIEKGNYKTIVTLRFNDEGYPISHGYQVIPKEEDKDEKRIEQTGDPKW